MQYQIKRLRQLEQVLPHQSAHAPADTIPHYRPAQHLTYSEADSRPGRTIAFAIKSCHVPGKMLSTLLVNHLKIRVLEQTRVPGEAL